MRNLRFNTLIFIFGIMSVLAIQMSCALNNPTILQVESKTINVDGKTKNVYTIVQADGTWGYHGIKGQDFNVIVKNNTNVPTGIHWHGILLPNNQDGVPGITQAPILPGKEYPYNYKLIQAGTYWMHSHVGLQAQDLMAAPLIITDPKDPNKSDQDVVVMFQDFTFKNPEDVLKGLKAKAISGMAPKNSANGNKNPMYMPMANDGMNMQKADLNDIVYDAFLTNYQTLQHPQIVAVKPGTIVRLRFIDGAAGSNFWINLGKLKGTAIAFDGANIKPFTAKSFQIAMGQRIDILVKIPAYGGDFSILGQVEGSNRQTGLILATANGKVPNISETSIHNAPALNYQQEYAMHSTHPLSIKPINKIVKIDLSGNMQKYIWMINGKAWPDTRSIKIKLGERVELVFKNKSGMAHPMHLHGHVFVISSINNHNITDGALHDTILVLPHSTVKVIFDANNPGIWPLHCHMEYHMATGMFTVINITP